MRVLTIKYADLLHQKKDVRNAIPNDWVMHVMFNLIFNTCRAAMMAGIPAGVDNIERLRRRLDEMKTEIGSVCFLYRGADVSAFHPIIKYFDPISVTMELEHIDGRRVYEARVRIVDAPVDLREIYTSLVLRYKRGDWAVYYDENGTVKDPAIAIAMLQKFFSK